MIGRHVSSAWYGLVDGVIERWEPLGCAATDVLVRDVTSGSLCWYASHSFTPIDGLGPLPSRSEAQLQRDHEIATSLQTIRDGLIADWCKPWPGAEHGKAIIGRSLDGAIADVQARLARRTR